MELNPPSPSKVVLEEEDIGPSVDSSDPEERIVARRLRIAKRREAEKRAALGEDLTESKQEKKELRKSKKQCEDSRLRLKKLKCDGTELVTNVKIAGDARESNRRTLQEENLRQRKDRLEQEIKTGNERYEEISNKWDAALEREIPQSLHEALVLQKMACDALVDEKNKLINDLQQELKTLDDQYVKDLKKQADNVDLIVERMEEQIRNLTKGYKSELINIEKAYVNERAETMELQNKKWEERMNIHHEKEEEYLEAREKRVEKNAEEIQKVRLHDNEEYNMVKIRLETDIQILEQQLQQMKATYQLNQEKLEYNFQVLKKRDEENAITKSQQKRKITKLHDIVSNLRIKLTKQEKFYRDENIQLTEDYKKLTEQFVDFQAKAKHFMEADAKTFFEIWCMNEEKCKELLIQGMLNADKTIHEQQLGMQWEQPDISFTENVGPIVSEASKKRQVSALKVVEEIFSHAGSHASKMTEQEESEYRLGIFSKISALTIKRILELLCNESGFLLESKLNTLLSVLEHNENMLMKLDAIFAALGIDTAEDIHLLSSYFLSFQEKSAQNFGEPFEDNLEIAKMSIPDSCDEVRDREELRDQMSSTSHLMPRDMVSLIHPNDVLKALRAFVEEQRKQPSLKEKLRVSHFKLQVLNNRDSSSDSAYWAKYTAVQQEKDEHLWDSLIDAMERYSHILARRAKLLDENVALQQQNQELKMLLHQYVNSKVNAELRVPPTRLLQLEMNPQHREN